MKQYCRYCINLCTGNGIWCEEKMITMRESTAKSVNHCDKFEFCGEDAFMQTNGYNPRTPKVDEVTENQISMNGGA